MSTHGQQYPTHRFDNLLRAGQWRAKNMSVRERSVAEIAVQNVKATWFMIFKGSCLYNPLCSFVFNFQRANTYFHTSAWPGEASPGWRDSDNCEIFVPMFVPKRLGR